MVLSCGGRNGTKRCFVYGESFSPNGKVFIRSTSSYDNPKNLGSGNGCKSPSSICKKMTRTARWGERKNWRKEDLRSTALRWARYPDKMMVNAQHASEPADAPWYLTCPSNPTESDPIASETSWSAGSQLRKLSCAGLFGSTAEDGWSLPDCWKRALSNSFILIDMARTCSVNLCACATWTLRSKINGLIFLYCRLECLLISPCSGQCPFWTKMTASPPYACLAREYPVMFVRLIFSMKSGEHKNLSHLNFDLQQPSVTMIM